ncbi:hypothetical protein GpartN1_g3151.t1 [Galdieria partita]|uniref:Uncharacterized protein n=1 Tax=Galdieria partita TaxID=83374 RepID=A0A9C7PVM9_9RHOD|nr:hypothetical protein GpartN1_g3151.t1 [Galdieria partita]
MQSTKILLVNRRRTESIYTRGLQDHFMLREIDDVVADYVFVEENSDPVAFLVIDEDSSEDSEVILARELRESYSLYFILFPVLVPSYNEKFLRFQDKFEDTDYISILPVFGDHTMVVLSILEILENVEKIRTSSYSIE